RELHAAASVLRAWSWCSHNGQGAAPATRLNPAARRKPLRLLSQAVRQCRLMAHNGRHRSGGEWLLWQSKRTSTRVVISQVIADDFRVDLARANAACPVVVLLGDPRIGMIEQSTCQIRCVTVRGGRGRCRCTK